MDMDLREVREGENTVCTISCDTKSQEAAALPPLVAQQEKKDTRVRLSTTFHRHISSEGRQSAG